jgi:hypothetical protein
MKIIMLILFSFASASCCNKSSARASMVTEESNPDGGRAAREKEIPVAVRDSLIKEAFEVARENGRSTVGMDIGVAEWSDSWMVWFSSHEKTKERQTDFVVKIYKDKKVKPRLMKGQ